MSARGLGRGFESLIPTDLVDEEFDPTAGEDEGLSQLKELRLAEVVRDEEQPRKDFSEEALEALAASIREHGVLQPIVVVKDEGQYKIVAGERRWRAAKLAGLEKIPAIVRTLDAQNRLELSVIENAQREDLNAIELATAYAKLKGQFNLTPKEIATRLGKSEASIINTMRLLNLPDEAKKAMREHKLTEGVMRPLVTAEPELIAEVLPKIVDQEWSARKVERYVAEHKKKSSTQAVKVRSFAQEEDRLAGKYGANVRVRGRTVTFSCKTDEDLKRLLGELSGEK